MQTPNEVEPCSTFPFRDIAVQKVIKDADPYILDLVEDKRVIDVGCCGSDAATRVNPFHAEISSRASYSLGIDIFAEGIANFKSQGLNVVLQDAESFISENGNFDLAIVSELIEHVSNPGRVLDSVYSQLTRGGEVLVTTPNPFGIGTILRRLLTGNSPVNSDHIAWFDPIFLTFLLRRSGFDVREILWMNTSKHLPIRLWQKFRPELHRTIGIIATKV